MLVGMGSEKDLLKEFLEPIQASRLSCEMHGAAAAAVQFALLVQFAVQRKKGSPFCQTSGRKMLRPAPCPVHWVYRSPTYKPSVLGGGSRP